MKRSLAFFTAPCAAIAALTIIAAAPAPLAESFPHGSERRLPNGAIVASQPTGGLPLVGAQVFLPAGLMQQPLGMGGIAAVAGSLVLQTPVEGGTSLADAAAAVGGSIAYTLDPLDTRYYLECRDADFPRLLHDLRVALAHPDVSRLAVVRSNAIEGAKALTRNPLQAAYAMVREVRYRGTGFASPDQGSALTLSRLTAADVRAFSTSYQRGIGTIVALEGAVTPADVDAAAREFGSFPAGVAPAVPTPSSLGRAHQVVAHRNVPAPWVAVAYEAPNQYSPDFATMLVIESLLGKGGDVHAFAFTSNAAPPADYIGAYYQFEAKPGSMIVFLGGESTNLDQSVRDLETGIARLRGSGISDTIITDAKRLALGDYYRSATNLAEEGWLLGRSAASSQGLGFENIVPRRIASVTAADVQRVARRYLSRETIAIVLPQTASQ
jgi:zinc protease